MAQTNKIQIIKYAPPPSELPVYGSGSTADMSFIGRTNYVAALEEKKFVFGIKRADRKRHLYILGKSGVGKSKLQELLIRQDIAYGQGVCLIDPHGDLVEDILNFVPEKRAGDVCVIDPSDYDFPVRFNPFSTIDVEFRHQFSQNFVELLQVQFKTAWSPRLEHVLRYAVRALLDYPGSTLAGIMQLLTDDAYRQAVGAACSDPLVSHFWQAEFKDWSEKYNTDTIIPIINKLTQFFSSSVLRAIFSNPENAIDFESLMQEKKIVLINLAQEKIGEDNASFLGSMLLSKIKEAGMNRAKLPRDTVTEFYLYLDEFENIITESFDSFLTGSRKYGINLTLSHQYLAQLSKGIQHAALTSAGTLIVFRVGGEDATVLKPEFAPLFDVKDMINLAIGEFYIKMAIDGESYDPFSAETLKVLPPPYASSKASVLEESRKKYASSKS